MMDGGWMTKLMKFKTFALKKLDLQLNLGSGATAKMVELLGVNRAAHISSVIPDDVRQNIIRRWEEAGFINVPYSIVSGMPTIVSNGVYGNLAHPTNQYPFSHKFEFALPGWIANLSTFADIKNRCQIVTEEMSAVYSETHTGHVNVVYRYELTINDELVRDELMDLLNCNNIRFSHELHNRY